MTLKVKVDGVFVATSGGEADDAGWVRNPAWPAFPAIISTDEKFIGQKAVFNHGSNFLALLARDAYHVDWGDGTSENVADNTQADHLYDFANANLYSHADLDYKVATVTVTPQVAASLTLITLNVKHTGITPVYETGWLDVALSMPNAATGAPIIIGGTTIAKNMMERLRAINIGGATSLREMNQALRGLRSFEIGNTDNVTLLRDMFNNCASLQTVPLFNTAAATSMQQMFVNCISLQTVPLFVMAGATPVAVATSMFSGCSSLQSIPALDLSAVTTTTGMFVFCPSLSRIEATPPKVSFSITGCNLSRAALVELFTALDTVVVEQTLVITGNWGIATLSAADRLIATDKNWALTE